jgi:hypothetical protein
MNRRNFLSGLAAIPFIGKFSCFQPKHDIYGKIVSCTLESHEYNNSEILFEQPAVYYKYVSFPIETTITIKFEKATVNYIAFNLTRDTIRKISDNPNLFITNVVRDTRGSECEFNYCREKININGQEIRLSSIWMELCQKNQD